jgi:DNA-binding beta-propeller fold protein YncE
MLFYVCLATAAAAMAHSQRLHLGTPIHSPKSRGEVLVVQESLNQVVLLRKDDARHRTVIKVGEKPHEIALSEDGRTAYISNFGLLEADHKVGIPGTTISVIDVVQKRERTRFTLPAGARAPHGLKVRPGHPSELFTNTEDGQEEMVVFNKNDGTVLRTFPLPKGVHNFIFSENGSDCYAFTTADSVVRLDPKDGRILAQAAIPKVRGLAWTSDHTRLLAGGRGQLLLLNPKDLTVTRTFANLSVGQIFYPSASPDGRFFFIPAVLDGVLLVIDAQTGELQKRIATGSPLQVVFDGKNAWVSNVKVPVSMLPAGASERRGDLVRLDLSSYRFRSIEDTEDANGIAVLP